jgi:hypothetical protein
VPAPNPYTGFEESIEAGDAVGEKFVRDDRWDARGGSDE